jgi:DNA modification methylase
MRRTKAVMESIDVLDLDGERTAISGFQLEQVPIDQLRPDPANPRRISDKQLEALTRSLNQFGFVQPVLARREDAVVIGGHQRLVAARRFGYREVPVIWLELSVEQSRLLNLALNRISGDWDEELLARLLADLAEESSDLSLTGFEEDEVLKLLKSLDGREKRGRPDDFDLGTALLKASVESRVKPGEIWRLGEHRLLCGDATDAEAVERLFGDQRADMAFTDPPYNVALGDHGGRQRGQRKRRIANDALSTEQWRSFIAAWAKNLLRHVDGAVYVCMSSKEWPSVSSALEQTGGHWSDTIIWAKDRFVLGRADYQRQYEPIWYGWREGTTRYWRGARDLGDVWRVEQPSSSELHPTMKPLELVEKAIENSSAEGAVVADFFLGSGSTLIACERTGRSCYGIELDPLYAAIAIARWEVFSGEVAERRG